MPSQETIHHRLAWRPGRPRTWTLESVTVDIDAGIDRLIVVSDLHGYREPLDGVDRCLQALPGTSVAFVNGDLFEGGMDGMETVEWVRTHAAGRTTRGNHDSRVFAYMRGQTSQDPPNQWARDAELGSYQGLREDQLQFLAELPDQIMVHWREKTIRILHGHQNPVNRDYTDWESAPDQLMGLFYDPSVDLTVIGHTHYPFVRKHGDSILANSGSVAVPIHRFRTGRGVLIDRDAMEERTPNRRAQSSLLSVTNNGGELRVEILFFDYDRHGLLDRYARQGDLLMPFSIRKTWILEGFLDVGPLAAAQRGEETR